MSLPNELPDIGSTAQRLRQNPKFDPVVARIGPEEYFVWTRFDGNTTLKDLILMTGFPTPRAIDIVRKLRAIGAILLPGEQPRAPVEEKPTTRFTPLEPEDQEAMSEPVDLSPDERRRILAMHRTAKEGDMLALFGISDVKDKKALKRAYFSLSKEFHPDRFYGKRTGSFGARLSEIFETMAHAYERLSDDKPRREPTAPVVAQEAMTPKEHAADLFERACQAEVSGDRVGALKLFGAALRSDPQAKYFRRAARCAINAGVQTVALEYAKKAANLEPNDPSTARLLAAAFKAAGKLADAEEVLVMALMIKTENDQLVHELQADLAEVRRMVSR